MQQIKQEFNKRAREIRTYTRAWLKSSNEPNAKFVIFGQTRTGSQLLTDLINSHPEVFFHDEIWHHDRVPKLFFPKLHIKGHSVKRHVNYYGFNLKINQVVNRQKMNPESLLGDLYHDGWKIISLKRHHFLRQAVSSLIARQRSKWHDQSPNGLKGLKLTLDCQRLLGNLKSRERDFQKETDILANIPHLALLYEDDLLKTVSHQNTLDRVFDYLGLDSVPVNTKLFRTTSDDLADVIENYDEVVNVISQTKYAKFLHDS